jgi:hypothetical protein
MLRALALVLLLAYTGCATPQPAAPLRTESLTSAETKQVDTLLEKLYRSFSHGDGEEPDWDLMRSVFVDGAQFVTEPPVGEAPNPQSVDAFISSWQASIRESESPTVATEEWITDARVVKVGRLIRADVVFQAKKRNEPAPRRPGLDSLVLVDAGGDWKILSFVVHYESKL